MNEKPEILGKSDFATYIGRSPAYVTQLKLKGRLVLTEDGKRVRVAESLKLMLETKGARDDVAARWALLSGAAIPEAREVALGAAKGDGMTARNLFAQSRAESEARKSAAQADQEEMARDKMAGNLIAREDVDAAMKFLGAAVRSALDVLPDQTAPVVAPVADLDEVHALLTDACRNVLVGLGEAIERQKAEIGKVKA